MKLIMAIVNNDDSSAVQKHLTKEGIQVTKLATTGGFLMSGNTTFIIGIEEDKVDKALEIIEKYSKQRKQVMPTAVTGNGLGMYTSFPVEVTVGGATVFVLDVERFEKL
ncbi:MAG: cyclic-di-AMP receptor [Bacillota bacterium]|nr:cyclic-di-AMP receptor [Bacillota bacterium]